MEIILKQDVTNLGYKDDIVNVKNGYANNYLIPQGMAIIATPSNRKMHAENMRQRAQKEEKVRKDAEVRQASLNGKQVVLTVKVGENNQLFGSVNNMMVAEALKEQHGVELDRKNIVVDGSKIKEVGEYAAVVNIYRDIKAELKLQVVSDKAANAEESKEEKAE